MSLTNVSFLILFITTKIIPTATNILTPNSYNVMNLDSRQQIHRGAGMQRIGTGHSGSSGGLASIPAEEDDDEGYDYDQQDFSSG